MSLSSGWVYWDYWQHRLEWRQAVTYLVLTLTLLGLPLPLLLDFERSTVKRLLTLLPHLLRTVVSTWSSFAPIRSPTIPSNSRQSLPVTEPAWWQQVQWV